LEFFAISTQKVSNQQFGKLNINTREIIGWLLDIMMGGCVGEALNMIKLMRP